MYHILTVKSTVKYFQVTLIYKDAVSLQLHFYAKIWFIVENLSLFNVPVGMTS